MAVADQGRGGLELRRVDQAPLGRAFEPGADQGDQTLLAGDVVGMVQRRAHRVRVVRMRPLMGDAGERLQIRAVGLIAVVGPGAEPLAAQVGEARPQRSGGSEVETPARRNGPSHVLHHRVAVRRKPVQHVDAPRRREIDGDAAHTEIELIERRAVVHVHGARHPAAAQEVDMHQRLHLQHFGP